MKKGKGDNEMRMEYKRSDLDVGERGKYYESLKHSNNLVLLRPEVAEVFPTDESVNEALMSLIKVARESVSVSD